MSTANHCHTLREYISQAMPVLMEIPGFSALATETEQEYDTTAATYPDATFAMMIMNNLFHHDIEFAAIHQQAFSSLLTEQIFHLCASAMTFAWMLTGKSICGMIDPWICKISRLALSKS